MVANKEFVVKSSQESAKSYTGGNVMPAGEFLGLPPGYVLDRKGNVGPDYLDKMPVTKPATLNGLNR